MKQSHVTTRSQLTEQIKDMSSNNTDNQPTCDLTSMNTQPGECTIRINFGYGSLRDGEEYKFNTCDHAGQMLLKYINNLYSNGKNIRHNVVNNLFTMNGNVDMP